MSMKTRSLLRLLASAIGAGVVLVATAVVLNRPRFDEALLPELQALKTARPPAPDQNGYTMAWGFLAANNIDPESAGRTILDQLNERYEAGARISIDSEERNSLLGPRGAREDWPPLLPSLECVARVDLDCADRIIAEVANVQLDRVRFAVLSQRFETMSRKLRFDEGEQRDAHTPFVPYGAIRDVGRIILAESFRNDPDAVFIGKAAEHLGFWRVMLRDAQTMGAKMVAVSGIQATLDFLSALMRDRALTPTDAGSIRSFVSALTPEELDISDGFVSEARVQVLSDELPLASGAPARARIVIQRNATLNDFYSNILQPMILRAKLSSVDFYRSGGNRPLDFAARGKAPLLFNRGGHRLISRMAWDPEQFVARIQDQNGRLVLVLLQSELEIAPDAERASAIASSVYRNPYTGEPMQYDATSQTIGFQCLHTAHHPPALPDRCAVWLGSP